MPPQIPERPLAATDGSPPDATASAPLPPAPGMALPSSDAPPAPPMPVAPVGWAPSPAPGADPRWFGRLASPWRRLGAYLIDLLVLAPAWIIAAIALVVPRVISDPIWDRVDSTHPLTPEQSQELVRHLQTRLFVPILLLSLGGAVLTGIYNVTLTRLRGQTVGKMAVGVKVVLMADGSLPTWGAAISRWALPAVAGLVPWVGSLGVLLIYIWMLWDPNKQGLHDKVAKTVVVRA